MDEKGFVVKAEKILLLAAAIFLALLSGLCLRDRLAVGNPGLTVEEASAQPQEIFVPEIRPMNVNAASAEELTALPGIGEVLARRIVERREEHGPFLTVESLMEVPGIGEAKLAALEGLITVEAESEGSDPPLNMENSEGN